MNEACVVPGAQQTVDGQTAYRLIMARCRRFGMTSWEDQVSLFELAMTRFGGVDIVVSARCSRCILPSGIDF